MGVVCPYLGDNLIIFNNYTFNNHPRIVNPPDGLELK